MTGPLLLLGRCGLERLAAPLRRLTGAEVVVAGWTQAELAERLRPSLIYVDLYDWDRLAPLTTAALVGEPVEVEGLAAIRAVVAALRGHPTVYRGLRRPLGDALGIGAPLPGPLREALDRLADVTAGERVLDVAALWARHGLVPDEVAHGLAHGEALGGAAEVEAAALFALWSARVRGPVKVVVVDLDDTLVHGRITDPDFAAKNPAYLPEGEAATAPNVEGWWRLARGLHEALRIVQRRGVVLALATRNDPAVVARRFRRRPVGVTPVEGMYRFLYDDLPPDLAGAAFAAHPEILRRIALGPEDFVMIEAGFGAKSAMCRSIADRLGVGLDTLAFLDDSPFERAEVRRNAPEVHVLEEPAMFRQELLFGPRFTVWERTTTARADSYRSRAAVTAVDSQALTSFLHELDLRVSVRPAVAADLPRARELLQRAHQLDLTGARPPLDSAEGVWIGTCRDRIADHGVVSVGFFDAGRLVTWACSCRVLPHRVAGTILARMLAANPGAHAERVATPYNAATIGLLEEGEAEWVTVE